MANKTTKNLSLEIDEIYNRLNIRNEGMTIRTEINTGHLNDARKEINGRKDFQRTIMNNNRY